MKLGARQYGVDERERTALDSMAIGTIGGDSKIGMPVVETRRVPLHEDEEATHECFASTFESTGMSGDTGTILVALGGGNPDSSIFISTTFEGGYSTISVSGGVDCVTITWEDGSNLYVNGVDQGTSGSVEVEDPNLSWFWFERGPSGTYSAAYTICPCS